MIKYIDPSYIFTKNIAHPTEYDIKNLVVHFNIHYCDMPEMQKQIQKLLDSYSRLIYEKEIYETHNTL